MTDLIDNNTLEIAKNEYVKNPLLGKWKASSLWYTPQHIIKRVNHTLDNNNQFYDPCPIDPTEDGLEQDWSEKAKQFNGCIYVNPPIPASVWAQKTITTFQQNDKLHIVYACYSIDVLWQVPELRYNNLRCMVRHRINWIDAKTMEIKKGSRNYNAFILFSNNQTIKNKFKLAFNDLGKIERSIEV